MCARGIKNEPYEEESKSIDIEQFFVFVSYLVSLVKKTSGNCWFYDIFQKNLWKIRHVST